MPLFSRGVKNIRKWINIIRGVITVKHMENTTQYSPRNYKTWKEYWEGKSGQHFPTSVGVCACCGKITIPKDFVGAHIEEVENHKKQYIYPLCNSCNDRYGEGKEESPEFDVIKSYCVPFLMSETDIVERLDE